MQGQLPASHKSEPSAGPARRAAQPVQRTVASQLLQKEVGRLPPGRAAQHKPDKHSRLELAARAPASNNFVSYVQPQASHWLAQSAGRSEELPRPPHEPNLSCQLPRHAGLRSPGELPLLYADHARRPIRIGEAGEKHGILEGFGLAVSSI